MRTNLYLVHNPYKRYKRKFLRSENEKWVIFNQNKFLINYMVNKLDYNNSGSTSTEDLCKFLHINGKLKGKKANDVYDKLNRFYYYDAKEAKMPIFDYMKHKLKEV